MRHLLLVFILFLAPSLKAKAIEEDALKIRSVEIDGQRFTDKSWLKEYLSLDCPCQMKKDELLQKQRKLLTTQVFQSADFALEPEDEGHVLKIKLHEKWTVIPVLRGAYGGGTPLLVAGAYDSHFLGSLYTLGAESRTYGRSPTGGVVWFRAPRWKDGHHYLNFELWKDNRIRSLIDQEDKEYASVYGSALAFNSDLLMPLSKEHPELQGGLRFQYRDQKVLDWDEKPQVPLKDLPFTLEKERTETLSLRLLYDDVSVSQLNLDGLRALLSYGAVFGADKTRPIIEQELFYYKLFRDDWNLVLHEYLTATPASSYQSLTFLGGFDSIRGIPDGALVGNRALYGNLELRKILGKLPYAWLQAAIYVDHGLAARKAGEWGEDQRTSLGLGMRLAIPQVHRLMFRIDYAFSLDRAGSRSISAGLNQFIDPYRPL